MTTRWILLLAIVASPLCRASTAADEQAINDALQRWLTAWETLDPGLAARDYSSDADFTNAFGHTRRGRAEVEGLMTEVFGLRFVMAGKTQYSPPEIRFVSNELALVRTAARRTGQQTKAGEELGVRQTTHLRVFEKQPDGWRIISHLISDARNRDTPEH